MIFEQVSQHAASRQKIKIVNISLLCDVTGIWLAHPGSPHYYLHFRFKSRDLILSYLISHLMLHLFAHHWQTLHPLFICTCL